jgi:hypothetical protein
MPDVRDRGPDQTGHAGIALDVPLPCHGADAQPPVRDGYLLQFGDPIEVNDVARPSEWHREHGHQALATGKGPGLVPVLGHDPQRLLKPFWPVVLERRWFQSLGAPFVMAVLRSILPQPARNGGRGRRGLGGGPTPEESTPMPDSRE